MQVSSINSNSRKICIAGKSGFTLIELLVVIAIIAILASILFPVFARVKAAAKQTSCLSNVHQLSLGVTMYSMDYDDTYPMGGWQVPQAPAIPTAYSRWYMDIQPYLPGNQIKNCPASPFKVDHWSSDYGLNSSIAPWEGSQTASAVNHTANLVLLSDSSQLSVAQLQGSLDNMDPMKWSTYAIGPTDREVLGPYVFYPIAYYPYTYPADIYGTNFRRPYAIHNGHVNVGFCDGHSHSEDIRALIGPMPTGYALDDPRNLWSNN